MSVDGRKSQTIFLEMCLYLAEDSYSVGQWVERVEINSQPVTMVNCVLYNGLVPASYTVSSLKTLSHFASVGS